MGSAREVDSFICMGAEIISLGLNQVRWKPSTAIAPTPLLLDPSSCMIYQVSEDRPVHPQSINKTSKQNKPGSGPTLCNWPVISVSSISLVTGRLFGFGEDPVLVFARTMTVDAALYLPRAHYVAVGTILCPEPVSLIRVVAPHFVHRGHRHQGFLIFSIVFLDQNGSVRPTVTCDVK